MQHVIAIVERHGLLIVFVNILLARGGLPLPVVPTLLMASALGGRSGYQIAELIAAGAGASLIGDFVQYWCGRRYGQRFLGLLCRVSFSPDFCVRQTETVFARLGPWALLFAKFIPGLSLISVAMAGVVKMSALPFFVLDGTGGLLFVGAIVALGALFHDAIASVLATLTQLGELGVAAVAGAIAIYVLIKWWQRRLFIRRLRMDRITIGELRKLMDAGETLVILDVRPKEVRAQDGIIPGAIAAHPTEIDPVLENYARDAEIVVYCACPNEESAATAARHLKQAGFKKIRPLLGGIDAWIEAGHPIERLDAAESDTAGELIGARAQTA